ncbi:MAG: alginate O-acetyltransferase complex protein AlgI [Parvicellaceae bacterium]|jgi:alginate O-acetyltransferase complex protein AlgI
MEIAHFHYLIFLVVSVLGFYCVSSKYKWLILLTSSLIFIGLHSWTALGLTLFLSLFNFAAGKHIYGRIKKDEKRTHLIGIILLNLLVLGLFKYLNLWNKGIGWLGDLFVFNPDDLLIILFLPIGISYIVFQAISYQIEIHREQLEPQRSLGFLMTYLAFFPKITAGPIEKPKAFIDQLTQPEVKYDNFRDGFRLLLWGLFKKIFISANIHALIQPIFDHSDLYSEKVFIVAACLYTIEIYADFSGYTDMARGAAKLFGIKLSDNFDRPLISTSLTEFWRRWHITLSTWVNDYVYTPLSMWLSLKFNPGKWVIVITILISFGIIGVWHGANWTFLCFGLIQAFVLILEILTKKTRIKILNSKVKPIIQFLGVIFTFAVFTFSCLFFKANGMSELMNWFGEQSYTSEPTGILKWIKSTSVQRVGLTVVCFVIVDHLFLKKGIVHWCSNQPSWLRWIVYSVLLYAILAGSPLEIEPFIYQAF